MQCRLGIPRKRSTFCEFPDGAALSGKSRSVAEPVYHTRQSNYTQYQDTVYLYSQLSITCDCRVHQGRSVMMAEQRETFDVFCSSIMTPGTKTPCGDVHVTGAKQLLLPKDGRL